MEFSFTLNEELRAVKRNVFSTVSQWHPVPHLLSLCFLLFVTHWHSEPTVLHPLGRCGMKRVMTLHSFPWDLVITGCCKEIKNTDSSLLPPAPPSLLASHQRGTCPLSIGRLIVVTVTPPPDLLQLCLIHGCTGVGLLSNAWGLWGVLLLCTHQWQTPGAAPSPSLPLL